MPFTCRIGMAADGARLDEKKLGMGSPRLYNAKPRRSRFAAAHQSQEFSARMTRETGTDGSTWHPIFVSHVSERVPRRRKGKALAS